MALLISAPTGNIPDENYCLRESTRLPRLEKSVDFIKSTIDFTSNLIISGSKDLAQRLNNYSNNSNSSCESSNSQNNSNNYSFRSGIKKLGVGLASTAIISTSVLAGMEAAQINNGNEQTKQRLEQLVDTKNVLNYLEKVEDFYF